jgi:hypothetical protein
VATLPRGIAGTAGEYLVAAQLSLKGWLATVTLKNAPGTDVLAQHGSGALAAIQTKTKTASKDFRLGEKDERPARPREWFILVDLKGEGARETDFYVVPRRVIAAVVYASHRHWLSRPGRGGRPRRDSPMRAVRPADVAGYRDRWDLLLSPPEEAPFLLGGSYPLTIREFGRPEDVALLDGNPEPTAIGPDTS